MRAFVIDGFGGPQVLRLAEMPLPAPGPGEVRVRVAAVAVARTKDVATRAGRPPFAPQIAAFPHILGTEHAGVVDEVGSGVESDLLGQRVAVSAVVSCGRCRACQRGHEEACAQFRLVGVHLPGCYAEYIVVPVANLSAVPAEVSLAEAASVAANGGVARAQLEAGQVDSGSVVLIVGAAGSLGSTAAALASWRGARVVGMDRLATNPHALDGLPLAARVDGEAPDLQDQLAAAAGPEGFDCIVDNLGLTDLWNAYRPALGTLGRIVVSGAINHDPLPMRLLPFYLHSQSLIGVRTGNRAQIAGIWQDVREGFRPPGSHLHRLPWADVAEAHRRVEAGTAGGQAVLEVA